MVVKYLNLKPDTALPDITALKPFRVVIVVDESVAPEWQSKVSVWLVESGCLYMMAWGKDCSTWDDSVDYANIDTCDCKEIPNDKYVITTWHENEGLDEVFWYAKHNACHPAIAIENSILLHISYQNNENELVTKYNSV